MWPERECKHQPCTSQSHFFITCRSVTTGSTWGREGTQQDRGLLGGGDAGQENLDAVENVPKNPGALLWGDVAAPGQEQHVSPGRRREKTKMFCISHFNKRGCALEAGQFCSEGALCVVELIHPEAEVRRGRFALDKLLYKPPGN